MEGAQPLGEILKLSREEAANVVGVRAWDLAHLNRLLSEVLASTPEPPPRPPSIFVSYRWESEAHRAWVRRFVHDLKGRGYDVYFDQDVQADRSSPLPVPELVSLVARASRFLIVLSEGYLQRIEPGSERGTLMDGWVWDEYQSAIRLAEIGRIKSWLIVWRSGDLPEWVQSDQVWDFRDDASYQATLEAAFPVRMVRIIGLRPDGSQVVCDPVERSRIRDVGQKLEASGEFDRFLIEHL